VLRKNQIEFYFARSFRDQLFQEKWINEVFEISEFGVTSHFPFLKRMNFDAEFIFDIFRVWNLRRKNMDFVTAPNHFFDEKNSFRRTASGWRIKRFVREKCDAQIFWHALTLDDFRARSQLDFMWKCFDLQREKFRFEFHFGWGLSSVGRAPQWHCGGQGFESLRLHHSKKLASDRPGFFRPFKAHAVVAQ
jgi:hypothetical protein